MKWIYLVLGCLLMAACKSKPTLSSPVKAVEESASGEWVSESRYALPSFGLRVQVQEGWKLEKNSQLKLANAAKSVTGEEQISSGSQSFIASLDTTTGEVNSGVNIVVSVMPLPDADKVSDGKEYLLQLEKVLKANPSIGFPDQPVLVADLGEGVWKRTVTLKKDGVDVVQLLMAKVVEGSVLTIGVKYNPTINDEHFERAIIGIQKIKLR